MKNKIFVAFAVAALSLTVSCAKKDGKIDPKQTGELSDLPAWVIDPSVEGTVAGVGIAAPSTGGIRFQIPKAELDAKANIAATIQSEISRVTKNALRSAKVNENADDVEDFFSQATKEVVKNFPLSGVKRINIFKAKDGTLYLHMALTQEDYSKYLQNSEKTFEARLKKSKLGRENINKSQEAVKSLFDELESERDGKKPALKAEEKTEAAN
jgi:uncharacterized membrane-anchored protein YhcB (DUF1043 family)